MLTGVTAEPRRRVIRVGIVDDHPLVREGTTALLGRRADIEVVGVASDGQSALQLVDALRAALRDLLRQVELALAAA